MTNPMTVSLDAGAISLRRQSGASPWQIANYWLRDNCACASCRHPGNGQKLYEISDLPDGLQVGVVALDVDGLMQVTWSDGHVSAYTRAWLEQHDLGSAARASRVNRPELWDASLAGDLPVGDWLAMLADPTREHAWLERYNALGVGVLHNVPLLPGAVAEVGDRLGFVRVTNYGRLFDVISVPNPTNLAYTAVGLVVHSDNPYRDPSPGVQLLHCLVSEAPGGDTQLVDGFKAAEMLRSENPAAFAILTRVPMNFRYVDASTELRARQTLISTDSDGVVRAVHFNNRSADWVDAAAQEVAAWYDAYRAFAAILKRPQLEVVFRLNPGDCVVMQNDRTLHGRTAFDPGRGRRHLQGCYIDADAMRSRLQVLRRALSA